MFQCADITKIAALSSIMDQAQQIVSVMMRIWTLILLDSVLDRMFKSCNDHIRKMKEKPDLKGRFIRWEDLKDSCS